LRSGSQPTPSGNPVAMAGFLTSVLGNSQKLDGGAMFGNAPRALWQKWIEPDDRHRITLACRSLLIEWGGQRILCEVGIGNFFEPKLAERFGVQDPHRHLLIENLNALGVDEASIDYVVLSHLHFDHAGGLLPGYDELQAGHEGLRFPKAQYVVGQEAWERARAPHSRDRASFIPELVQRLEKSGRLLMVQNEAQTCPGFFQDRAEWNYSHGHTPGQMHLVFRGDHDKVFFAGDLIPGLPWVHVPITMGYDRFPEKLIDEKKELYARIEEDPCPWVVFFTHDPQTATARLRKDSKNRFQGADSQAILQRRPF